MENAGSAAMLRLTCALKSAKRPLLSKLSPFWVATALCASLIGCGNSPDHAAGVDPGDAGTVQPIPTGSACDTPNEGCACATAGEAVDCGRVERTSGSYVSCSMGQRTCSDGKWGACIGDRVATLNLATGLQRTQNLGTGNACTDNPCDPYCRVVVDDPTGLPLPDGGALTNDGGLQVVPHEETGVGGLCTSMKVKPTPQTLTVNGFTGSSLSGDYFTQVDKTVSQISTAWVPVATVSAANIDLDSSDGTSSVAAVGNNSYSIRWTGKITAATSESYTLCAASDDGVRLWIDGALIINSWIDQHGNHCATPISWTAGSKHDLRFEFYQAYGGAQAILYWQTPTIPQTVVPASAFVGSGGSQVTTTSTAKFSVDVLPAGCLSSAPTPAWTLDHLDIATIGTDGTVNLISGVAGPITVTAYLGQLSATGVVNVVVNMVTNDSAPAGSVAAFQGAVSGTDPAKILYPYDQTVLPIGLRAPLVQWDNMGTAASAVKVTLQFPTSGAPLFTWSEILPESNPPQASIPRDVWKFFEQTAKGQPASFSVQRLIGGQLRPAMTRTVNFSSTPIRGKIYYTQYHRNIDANEMQADPGSENPAQPAFGSTDGCPVCHTLSASGNVFATSSRVGITPAGTLQTFSATLGGISSVNANGTLSPIADFVSPNTNYTGGTKDWRGFAWAPITPDGKYALAANNVWGNSTDQVVGINTGTRQVNTGNTMLSGGSGTGLLAQYYPSTNYTGTVWKRFEPQINYDFGTGSPGGLITANYSVKRTGQIQAFFSETYKFEVVSTSADAFTLSVGGTTVSGTGPTTLTANLPMTAGALVPFELDAINAAGASNVQLFWSSPSTPRALVPQSQLFPPAAEPIHGATVTYRDDATGTSVTRLEPDIASDFVDHNPAAGIAPDNWRSTWDAQIESPYGGAMKICVDSDDAVTVTVDGTVLNSLTSGGGVTSNCSTEALTWTVGSKHPVHIVHHEDGGNAHIILKYQYGGGGFTEVIPSANLTPPVGYTPPATGLTATYYDIDGFNVSLSGTNNQTNPRAFQRIDPNIDFDFGSGRPNYSVISGDDNYSARWTGKINLSCAGVYEFRSNGNVDDGGRLWIDNVRLMSRWNVAAGPLIGAAYFDPGLHDFKFDYYENTGSATVQLQWKTPCVGSTWVTVPSSVFTPASPYTRATGFVVDGGDNGNNTSYWVWQTPTVAAPTPVDVTAARNGNWGLEGATMMVPAFSPDGTKLVFIDGDSGGGAGWRKGVSTFDFDQAGKLFKNRRLIANNWPQGDALKWPTFESDSRSVIFQSTVPGDYCCRNNWTKYGYMGPTNYYEDPGRLWSVDSQATPPAPVALTKLNSGEGALDANKSYQPTMLPVAAGGYRWVVFTSTRPYGNTLNLPAVQQDFSNTASYANSSYTANTNYSQIQSQLWVSAIDDSVSGATDRSHPGFWLPNQNYATDATSGYVNERGFWVLDACHPTGTSNASSCEVDDDCCGGTGPTKTAACRLDTPLASPPTRHCQALPPVGSCAAATGSCGSAADCCTGLVCVNAACQTPPPVLVVGDMNYERVYQSDCPNGTKVVWRFFDWQAVTPATNSKLEVYAETEADPTMFATLASAPTAITTPGVLKLADITTSNPTTWTGSAVSLALDMAKLKSQQYLKITVRFVPNDERTLSPILKDWRQSYSCVPAE